MGIDIQRTHFIHEILMSAWDKMPDTNLITLSIGISSIVILLFLKKWKPLFPAALVVVVLSTLAVWLFDLNNHGVKIVGAVPAGLPSLSLPQFDLQTISTLLPSAIAISMVSFIESISVAKAVARKHKYDIQANQELIGLGLANIIGSVFKAYPITGGFSRTAVNIQAGAKTNLASIITGSVVIIVLLLLTPLFYYLPKAVLAAIIMTAVYTLIDIEEVKHLYKVKKGDLALLLTTFFATLTLGIEQGILLGVSASLLWFITKTIRPHSAVLGRIPGTTVYRNIKNFPQAEQDEGVLVLRVDAQFYFGNINFLKEFISEEIYRCQTTPRVIVIEAASINQLDSSAQASLQEICEELENRGIDLYFANVKSPVKEVMEKSGFEKKLGYDHFFMDLHSAVMQAKTTSASSWAP
ncbi:MAG: SulP family inorganic anion transporter, partial [Gammaproteobacteria bacterium]|nr:SulP family inorganic anion transporter [Gammaproteobacteria bacterium]